jgi:hypothetical protein
MTHKNSYNFPAEEIRQELKRKKGIVNIIVSEDAPVEEKMKYSVSQSLLFYQQKNKKTFKTLVKEIGVPSLNEKKLIDICRGKLDDFCLGELVVYAINLGITIIPCYDCRVNLYPSLLEALILSLKDQEILPTNNFYQTHFHHHHLV